MNNKSRFADKVFSFRTSLTLALKDRAKARLAEGKPVYDFGLGEVKGELNQAIRVAGAKAFEENQTHYTHPSGIPELREAVLDWLELSESYSKEEVVISTGAKQSLFNILLTTCNVGDVALYDRAPWVSYIPLTLAAEAKAVCVGAKDNNKELKVRPSDLEQAIAENPRTRLFLLNNPCNPTSQLYSEEEVNGLLDVCVKNEIYFVLDRLYWKLIFDGKEFPEPKITPESKKWLIQVDGMSKNFINGGGLRIGWCVCDRELAAHMVNLQSHYTAAPSTPTQFAALGALTTPYSDDLKNDLARKRDVLREHYSSMPLCKILPTEGAFYSFWDISDAIGKKTPAGAEIKGSEDLAKYLFEDHGVVVAPGSGFEQDNHLRLSFAIPDQEIIDGMAVIRKALSELS